MNALNIERHLAHRAVLGAELSWLSSSEPVSVSSGGRCQAVTPCNVVYNEVASFKMALSEMASNELASNKVASSNITSSNIASSNIASRNIALPLAENFSHTDLYLSTYVGILNFLWSHVGIVDFRA